MSLHEKWNPGWMDELLSRLDAAENEEENNRPVTPLVVRDAPVYIPDIEESAHIEEVTSMELPLDWENAFAEDSRAEGIHTDSIADGLVLCLNNIGRVDIEYISLITSKTPKECITALKGSIYQNPETWEECFYKGWETADEYLSGNLSRKWTIAREQNDRYRGYFEDNLTALQQVLPPTAGADEIYITLGSPWVPTDIIDDFIQYLMKDYRYPYRMRGRTVRHDELTGVWEIPQKRRYSRGRFAALSTTTYGTRRMEALQIIEKTLNIKTIVVTDEVPNPKRAGGTQKIVNQEETIAALEKQQLILTKFKDWVFKHKERRARLTEIFEERYGRIRRRQYDGSFLSFPTMNEGAALYPYQKNAVARILFSPNTLLAHDVGAGKTYIMAAAAAELRRMGIARKNLFVVPNNLVGQWRDIFLSLYSAARLLTVTPADFTPAKRQGVLRDIRDGDYDGIIMAYSCFEAIPLSKEFYIRALEEEHRELSVSIAKKNPPSSLSRRLTNISKKLASLMGQAPAEEGVYFDTLGINTLFVDEAHNYKNVPIDTQVTHILGINRAGSKKCQDMLHKVRCVQRQNGGRGVVMATGTPITNSITDIYVLQQYLQSGELSLMDLSSFDSWIGMFAEQKTDFEVDVDTSSYRLATRFSKFHNLPELTALLSGIADFHITAGSTELPDFDGYTDILVPRSAALEEFLKEISKRADEVRGGKVDPKEDNMLKITVEGRKAALDIRLVGYVPALGEDTKVQTCARNIFEIYRRYQDTRATQLVFCDSSTPKPEFNMYHCLREILIAMGIPSQEIAFIHDANTEKRRATLFAQVQRGEIRVLLGSTFKLGLGVNVQERLVALHHLDVPWRPADMVQREGRILRWGNQNERVHIFRYITEGSFDAYSWQLLETKQRFISDLLSGSIQERSGADIDSTVLDYAEVKALAVGNDLIKERIKAANELSRYMILAAKSAENKERMETELAALPHKLQRTDRLIENCDKDIDELHLIDYDKPSRKQLRKALFAALSEGILATEEKTLFSYQGFAVIRPAGMIPQKRYVWLERNGRYYVETGDTEVGALSRIDNFLKNLANFREQTLFSREQMLERQASLQEELTHLKLYGDEIEACRKKLDRLDRKLGI